MAQIAAVARPVTGRKGTLRRILRDWQWYLFVAPFFVTWLATTPFTLSYAAVLSFYNWKAARTDWKFVGFFNYELVFQDPDFLAGLRNLIYFWIGSVIPGILLAMFVAFILHQFKWGGGVRTIMMLPMVTSAPVVVLVFKALFSQTGVINNLIGSLGIPSVDWFGDRWAARLMVLFLGQWGGLGVSSLIFGGAMDSIPKELYEAAEIDGAGKFAQFRHVTIPGLTPVIVYFIVTGTMGVINMLDTPYLLTGGGPQRATTTPAYVMWQKSFYAMELGYGTAMAWVLGFLTLVITLITLYLTFMRRKQES